MLVTTCKTTWCHNSEDHGQNNFIISNMWTILSHYRGIMRISWNYQKQKLWLMSQPWSWRQYVSSNCWLSTYGITTQNTDIFNLLHNVLFKCCLTQHEIGFNFKCYWNILVNGSTQKSLSQNSECCEIHFGHFFQL